MSASNLASTLMAQTLIHDAHALHPRTRRTMGRLYAYLAEGSHPTNGVMRDECLREFLSRNIEDSGKATEMVGGKGVRHTRPRASTPPLTCSIHNHGVAAEDAESAFDYLIDSAALENN